MLETPSVHSKAVELSATDYLSFTKCFTSSWLHHNTALFYSPTSSRAPPSCAPSYHKGISSLPLGFQDLITWNSTSSAPFMPLRLIIQRKQPSAQHSLWHL